MHKKVVILCGGYGKRLGVYTKYFNKGLLKIGDKAAISHIISYFPQDHEFIFVLGYLGDIVQQYIKVAHPDIKATFVWQTKDNAGPGAALLDCYDLIDGPFYLFCNDTLISGPLPVADENWIGYAKAQSLDGEYSCIQLDLGKKHNTVTAFYEKGQHYTGYAYIGAAYIRDCHAFMSGLKYDPVVIGGQSMVSAGFYKLIEKGLTIKAEELSWHDIGELDKLQEVRKKYPSKIENLNKVDEEIYFLGDKVIKYFHNSEVAKNRVKRAQILKDFVPEIEIWSSNFYSYKFVDGMDLFDKSLPIDLPSLVESVLDKIWQSGLWKEKTLSPEEYMKFQQACVDFYYRKTKNRLDSLYKQLHFEDSETTINGEQVPKLKDLLSILPWQKILNGKPCLMHGDMALSNIILTPTGDIKFIDWRDSFGGLTEVGDMYYDLAKCYATLLFPHDIIKQKRFTISISGSTVGYSIEDDKIGVHDKYGMAKHYFESWLKTKNIDAKKVKQLTSIVLLNMSPLHASPLNVLLYYLGKKTLFDSLKD
jgi:NDP-sugar pyrophosphorylase family protein